jgi:predicted TIM-barrel fold metal-dependent hydrolase
MATSFADTEIALEPELAICDAHHHLWVRGGESYSLDDFVRDAGTGHNIRSTVLVECGTHYWQEGPAETRPLGETEFFESAAIASGRERSIKVAVGIVGHADLRLGDRVAPVLEAHMAISPKRFRGIRHQTTYDADPALRSTTVKGLLADAQFRRAVACLAKYNLSYDAWLYHTQIDELIDLARAIPTVTIILDHIAAPLGIGPYKRKRSEVFQVWSRAIAELATCASVAIKLGGFGSLRSGYDWHERKTRPGSLEIASVIAPYFEFCIEKFGVDRCMFESNFPVDKRSYDYVVIWNAFKRITQNYSRKERAALFHDTAARLYRLSDKLE